MQVLYTLYTDVASKNLNCFSLFFFVLSFNVHGHFIYILFQYYGPAQLQLEEKTDTTPLLCVYATVCVWADGEYMCVCVYNVRRRLCCLFCIL